MIPASLSDQSFRRVAAIFEAETGIRLTANKRALVQTRLTNRVQALKLKDLDQYCSHLETADRAEYQALVDHLTTNETYFFREREHFDLLTEIVTRSAAPIRVWSAACSSGEEAYSLAMVLATCRVGRPDTIRASDISARVLAKAAKAIYSTTRLGGVPESYLRAYFLRGTGKFADSVRVAPPIRQAVSFFQHNLMCANRSLGQFDIVFLRNALIYFEPRQKQLILENVLARLRTGGYLFIGLSESLSGHDLPVKAVGRSTYRKL